MIPSGECLGTRHSVCSSHDNCSCHCHEMAKLPFIIADTDYVPVILDAPLPTGIHHEGHLTIQTEPEVFFSNEEYREYLTYLQQEEYDSGYYQGFYLDEPEVSWLENEILEGLVRPVTKAELEAERLKQEKLAYMNKIVVKATEKIKAKPRQVSLDEMFGAS